MDVAILFAMHYGAIRPELNWAFEIELVDILTTEDIIEMVKADGQSHVHSQSVCPVPGP